MNPKLTPKERGLIKGALRRVFSRSDLCREIRNESVVSGYSDKTRPRVKKWSICTSCSGFTPTYLTQLDHVIPVVPLDRSLEEMTADELIDRLWCDKINIKTVCKPCHKIKTREETKIRRENKNKEKMKNETTKSNPRKRRIKKENKASRAGK